MQTRVAASALFIIPAAKLNSHTAENLPHLSSPLSLLN